MEQLKDNLTQYKFSLSLDNTTIGSENLCAMKAKNIEIGEETKVQNKIIGFYKLQESSSGQLTYRNHVQL